MMEKWRAFFISVLILFGIFGSELAVKTSCPQEALSLPDTDISAGIKIPVPRTAGAVRFNRISFQYTATAPVRAVFVYQQGARRVEEELLLSETEHAASMLLEGYLQRKTASRLLAVRFAPMRQDDACKLSVSGFTCDVQTVPRADVLYLENEHYKIGVKLNWGGGLCYFEDKTNGSYGNLLNCHDTGRLVQQSYYGPTEIEGYENGVYSGAVWGYNPVQGGDQYGNVSKLVALETAENRIRVVCRPLDWALNNVPTQTYYTSVYELTGSGLTAFNTAVDFLATAWGDRQQEIPAFYTVSALGNFTFYDGAAPWTDAPLRTETDLGFWAGKPAFELDEDNSETWCAWTDGTGYGVGLYTPAATQLLAGRFQYNGTSDPEADPTNYVAPLGVFRLRFGEPYTYTFYLTAGSVGEIRQTFKEIQAQAGPERQN